MGLRGVWCAGTSRQRRSNGIAPRLTLLRDAASLLCQGQAEHLALISSLDEVNCPISQWQSPQARLSVRAPSPVQPANVRLFMSRGRHWNPDKDRWQQACVYEAPSFCGCSGLISAGVHAAM